MGQGIEDVLRENLRAAMRTKDSATLRAVRSALARLANAEAVPIETMPRAGAVEAAIVGPGGADAPRRELTEDERRALLADEIAELESARESYRVAGHEEAADVARASAELLRRLLAR